MSVLVARHGDRLISNLGGMTRGHYKLIVTAVAPLGIALEFKYSLQSLCAQPAWSSWAFSFPFPKFY